MLECGHRCPTVCGEECPSSKYCQECCDSQIKSRVVDFITYETYEDLDLDTDPVIILPCGHLFSASTLDGHMNMKAAYKSFDEGKTWTGLKLLTGGEINHKPKDHW